jgi:hypothetical protein
MEKIQVFVSVPRNPDITNSLAVDQLADLKDSLVANLGDRYKVNVVYGAEVSVSAPYTFQETYKNYSLTIAVREFAELKDLIENCAGISEETCPSWARKR